MPRISVLFNEVQKLLLFETDIYRVEAGHFSKVDGRAKKGLAPLGWCHCREEFHVISKDIRKMLFCHKPNTGRAVATFLYRAERKLKLGKTRFGYSVCGPTQHNKVMWIKLSQWWLIGNMRRSFLTALLRAGQNYDVSGYDFEEALWTNRYLRQSKYAVLRFLRGYANYTGDLKQWNTQFFWGGTNNGRPKSPSQKEIRKLLAKS